MGRVVRFPKVARAARARLIATESGSATVIILPVIRIERYQDEPFEAEPSRTRRRRRHRVSHS
jgi:hypothetical protein